MVTPITQNRIQLTEQERRILEMLAVQGYTQDRVALEIHKSKISVKLYLKKIRERLGVESTHQVIAIAVKRGWIQAPESGKRRD